MKTQLVTVFAIALALGVSCGYDDDQKSSTPDSFAPEGINAHHPRTAVTFSIFDPQSPPQARTRCWYYASEWKAFRNNENILARTQTENGESVLNSFAITDKEFLQTIGSDTPDLGDWLKGLSDNWATHWHTAEWWRADLNKSALGHLATMGKSPQDHMKDVISHNRANLSISGMPCPRPLSARFYDIAIQNIAHAKAENPNLNENDDPIANAILDGKPLNAYIQHQQSVQNRGDYSNGEGQVVPVPANPLNNQTFYSPTTPNLLPTGNVYGFDKAGNPIYQTPPPTIPGYEEPQYVGQDRGLDYFVGKSLAVLIADGYDTRDLFLLGKFVYLGYSPALYKAAVGEDQYDLGSSLNNPDRSGQITVDLIAIESARVKLTVRSHALAGNTGYVDFVPSDFYLTQIADPTVKPGLAPLDYTPELLEPYGPPEPTIDAEPTIDPLTPAGTVLNVDIQTGDTITNLHTSYTGSTLYGEYCALATGDQLHFEPGSLEKLNDKVIKLKVAEGGSCSEHVGKTAYLYAPNYK